jgi:hypothetical protein
VGSPFACTFVSQTKMIRRRLCQRTVLREFLDSVLYVAPVIVPRSRFATNDRSHEGGSVRRTGTYAKPSRLGVWLVQGRAWGI